VSVDEEIALAALLVALEQGRISLESYYRQHAAIGERYGSLAVLTRGAEVVWVTWAEWLDAALESLIVL